MKVSARHRARQLAVQGLYEWKLSDNPVEKIIQQCLDEKKGKNLDHIYFQELMDQVTGKAEKLDKCIEPYLNRTIGEVDPVEHVILLLAAYELTEKPDIPYRVIINEAIELAKTFGAEQSHKFINGILDALATSHRTVEVTADKKK